jgi:aminoglycoside phosphotransferase (APT) family kinase protein
MRALARDVAPHIEGHAATDAAQSLLRTLALLVVDEEWDDAANAALENLVDANASAAGTAADRREQLRAHLADAAFAGDTGRAIETERQLQREIARRRDEAASAATAIDTETPHTATDEIPQKLRDYLRHRFPQAPALRIVNAVQLPGGRSKLTYRLTLEHGAPLPEHCVLRLDRREALIDSEAAAEFQLLRTLWQRDIPVPEPLLAEADRSILGGTFVLVGLIEGSKGGEYFPEVEGSVAGKRQLGLDLATILGKLHAIPLPAFDRRSETADAFTDRLRADIEQTYARARAIGVRMVEFEAAHRWLLDHIGDAWDTPCLQHGDIGLHNLIVRGDRVAGLLDWELAAAGPAVADLAACRHLVDVLMPWRDFADAYLAAGGSARATDPAHLDFHTVYRCLRIVATSQLCAHLFLSGQTNDFVLANAGHDSAIRARALLVEAMARVGKATPAR